MVAIEHRQTPATTATTTTTTPTSSSDLEQQQPEQQHEDGVHLQAAHPEDTEPHSTPESTLHCLPTVQAAKYPKMSKNELESAELAKRHQEAAAAAIAKSAVSQRHVDISIANKPNADVATQELTKKVLKLDLTGNELDEFSLKSPKSPIGARLPHQTSLTSSVDVEDRKTLREALYQGIFHRHRRTIFAVGSFLRMLRSRNSQYNTIRSSSEGEDTEEAR